MVWRWSNDRIIHIDWTWDHGKVHTVIEYESGDKDVRENKEPPPTKACHDIAHFICAMHDDLEWDYELDPNHIVEYNAVFVEHLLIWFCHSYYHECEEPPGPSRRTSGARQARPAHGRSRAPDFGKFPNRIRARGCPNSRFSRASSKSRASDSLGPGLKP